MTKTCTGCGKEKLLDEFHKDSMGYLGHKARCKVCISEYMKEWGTMPEIKVKKKEWQSSWSKKSTENRLLNSARERAKKAGIPFSLKLEDIVVPAVCPALGIPLKRGDRKRHDGSPTLDRFVDKLGYIPENVSVISYRANRIKNDGTLEELIKITEWMKSMVQSNEALDTSHNEPNEGIL